MNSNIISFQISKKQNIIDIAKLSPNTSFENPIRYMDGLYNTIRTKEIIKYIISLYPTYDFWWYEHGESIKHKTQTQFFKKIIIDSFKEVGASDKLFFIDNDLYPTEIMEDGFKFISEPMLIGYTSIHPQKIKPRKFKKKFICLNRVDKQHRRDMFDFLNKHYQTDSYLSYAPEEVNNERHLVLDDLQNEFYKTLFGRGFVSPHQTKSFCNIVTETSTYNKSIHITEKTDKCFTVGQPFVLVAGPFYLQKLKELGFKTFDKWWSEEYDNIINYEDRLVEIKKTINYIGKLTISECEEIYTEMIPILKHNRDLASGYYSNGVHNIDSWKSISIDISDKFNYKTLF